MTLMLLTQISDERINVLRGLQEHGDKQPQKCNQAKVSTLARRVNQFRDAQRHHGSVKHQLKRRNGEAKQRHLELKSDPGPEACQSAVITH